MTIKTGLVDAFQAAAKDCPLAAAVSLVGERWNFLILRATMLGLKHFDEYQACLGIARNVLSDRLGKLVNADILKRESDPGDRRRIVYRLTDKGRGLLPALVALRQWGLECGYGGESHPTLVDRKQCEPVSEVEVRARDGRLLRPGDLTWVDKNGQVVHLPWADYIPASMQS